MKNVSRTTFLKQSLAAGALVLLNPVAGDLFASGNRVSVKDDAFLKRLVTANDIQVEKLLAALKAAHSGFGRKLGYDFAQMAASYCSPDSRYFHHADIVPALEKLVQLLMAYQSDDGTLNFGNLESPPDTAFLLEPLSAGAFILVQDNSSAMQQVNGEIKKFIVRSGDALATGGVHTPNHRFVISAALARLNALYPNPKYVNRINDWLGEGIFNDSDGHFPERSMNYANVEDTSMITIGRLLNRPALFIPARKNLQMTYYYMEPNGDLVTVDSRRQDQYGSKSIVSFYLHYRYLAIKDKNSHFAAIASLIETMKGFEEEIVNNSLFHFLEDKSLQEQLPVGTTLPLEYEKLFNTSHVLRIRRGDTTATLFGGADWPIIIASGRSNSPNIFSYRKGKAILKYLRLSTNFFSMGYFYSDGLTKTGNGYVLHKKQDVPYYQPLPKNLRKASGDYTLSPSIDDRFWNKMDFQHRPVSNVKTMDTTVTLTENKGKNDLHISIKGPAGISVTVELCFKEGGKLAGVTNADNDNNFLEKGEGTYEFEGDTIRFGPGAVSHKMINNLEGERYSTHFGSLRTEGIHVFLTGVSPFEHTVTFQ